MVSARARKEKTHEINLSHTFFTTFGKVPLWKATLVFHSAPNGFSSFAHVGIRQIFHKVFSSLLIPFVRNDDMPFVKINTRGRIYTGYFLDPLKFGRKFPDSNTSP